MSFIRYLPEIHHFHTPLPPPRYTPPISYASAAVIYATNLLSIYIEVLLYIISRHYRIIRHQLYKPPPPPPPPQQTPTIIKPHCHNIRQTIPDTTVAIFPNPFIHHSCQVRHQIHTPPPLLCADFLRAI